MALNDPGTPLHDTCYQATLSETATREVASVGRWAHQYTIDNNAGEHARQRTSEP